MEQGTANRRRAICLGLLLLQLQSAASFEDCKFNMREQHCHCHKIQPYNYKIRCNQDASLRNMLSVKIEMQNTIQVNCAGGDVETANLLPNLGDYKFFELELLQCNFTANGILEALLQKLNAQHIETLKIRQCEFGEKFTRQTFAQLSNLRHLQLLENRFVYQHDKAQQETGALFGELPQVEELQVNGTTLRHIGKAAFGRIATLRTLDLRNNAIESVDAAAFAELTELEDLNVGGNNLSTLPLGLLRHNAKLAKFTLDRNGKVIRKLPTGIFHNLPALREVRLSCGLEDIADNFFTNSTQIEQLELAQNKLSEIPYELMSILPHLQRVDLSSNRIRRVTEPRAQIIPRNLGYLDEWCRSIHFRVDGCRLIMPHRSHIIIMLDNNSFDCDCQLERLLVPARNAPFSYSLQNVRCRTPAHLAGRPFYTLVASELLCPLAEPGSCPTGCKCWQRKSDEVLLINCTHAGLQVPPAKFPRVEPLNLKFIELQLEHNKLTALPSSQQQPSYASVGSIRAAHNQISQLLPENLPDALVQLDLQHNRLSSLQATVLAELERAISTRHLESLLLAHNPWNCDAAATPEMLQFMRKQLGHIGDFNEWRCTFEHEPNTAFTFFDAIRQRNECDQRRLWNSLLALLCCCLVVCIAVALFYKHKPFINMLLYAHNICRRRLYLQETQPDNMLYDAYVAYAEQNKEYVETVLIPQLEAGPIRFKLCIDWRDWGEKTLRPDLVGYGKTLSEELIVCSMDQSRRIIVVLTRDFLNSTNGMFSLRMACRGKLTDRRNRVIIILFGDLGDHSQFDREIQIFMQIHPCFHVGERFFWQKLCYAMPHVIPKGMEPVRMTQCADIQ